MSTGAFIFFLLLFVVIIPVAVAQSSIEEAKRAKKQKAQIRKERCLVRVNLPAVADFIIRHSLPWGFQTQKR
ncbi:MAG: hypothetical protein NC418_01830 [Muribaculaceae bacterium]|nr:hypothetical protein [Muribaculaceae bacterium]